MAEVETPTVEHEPYTITADEQSEELTPGGTFQDVHRVSFQIASGSHGYIRIPEASYSAANVHRLVQEKADEMAKVAKLTGGSSAT